MIARTEVVFNGLPAVLVKVLEGAHGVCVAGAEAMAVDMRRRIEEGPKTGVKYPGLPNRSSAPGESPANQFGDLLGSVDAVPETDAAAIGAEAVAGYGNDVAIFLEAGTSKMAPRPFMTPSVETGEVATVVALEKLALSL